MSGKFEIKIKVTPEKLEAIAEEVEVQINAMKKQFDEVNDIVNRSSFYWEGDGQISYVQAYRSKYDEIQNALRYFTDNVTNLRTIAGIYTATESAITEEANTLVSDVII